MIGNNMEKELLAEVHPDIPYNLVEEVAKLVYGDDEDNSKRFALFLILRIRNALRKNQEKS